MGMSISPRIGTVSAYCEGTARLVGGVMVTGVGAAIGGALIPRGVRLLRSTGEIFRVRMHPAAAIAGLPTLPERSSVLGQHNLDRMSVSLRHLLGTYPRLTSEQQLDLNGYVERIATHSTRAALQVYILLTREGKCSVFTPMGCPDTLPPHTSALIARQAHAEVESQRREIFGAALLLGIFSLIGAAHFLDERTTPSREATGRRLREDYAAAAAAAIPA